MLLRVRDLHTHFFTPGGAWPAVSGVALDVPAGETVALVGESGCGKSVTALSILRLVPPPGRIVGGAIELEGVDLRTLSPRALRAVRGRRIGMIFQEPMTSLNPLLTAGEQIAEGLRLHQRVSARAARTAAVELLRRVRVPAPEQRGREYPHQLSGGMRQRVMIAAALACGPQLLIADEPTTALDVTVQAQILALLREIQQSTGMGLLFITHDLGVVAQIADEVCVMYAGRIVERGPARVLFAQPRHPYTQALLRSVPQLARGASTAGGRRTPLPVIPGEVPSPGRQPPGCPFHPRCEHPNKDRQCQAENPPLVTDAAAHGCACWKT